MKKMLFVLTVLISIIFCISVAVAVSTDDHITGNITVIDSNLVYGYSYSQVSSDYYYTSPGGGKDAYYYLVSAEGEIKLNVSNITVDQGFDQDYVDKNFVNDLKAALDEQDSGPGSGPCIIEVDLYASMGPSQVPMTSASLDGDILTVKFNGTQLVKYDQKSGLSDDWGEKNVYFAMFVDREGSPHYHFTADLDNVEKIII